MKLTKLIHRLEITSRDNKSYDTYWPQISDIFDLFIDCILEHVKSNRLYELELAFSELLFKMLPELDQEKISTTFIEYEKSLIQTLNKLDSEKEKDPYVAANPPGINALYLIYIPNSGFVRPVIHACCKYSSQNHDWTANFSGKGQVELDHVFVDWEYDDDSFEREIVNLFIYVSLLIASCRAVCKSSLSKLPFSFSYYDSPTDIIDIGFENRDYLVQ